jgi:hypothetical protein
MGGLLETPVRSLPQTTGKPEFVIPQLPPFVLDKHLPPLSGCDTPPEGVICLPQGEYKRSRPFEKLGIGVAPSTSRNRCVNASSSPQSASRN